METRAHAEEITEKGVRVNRGRKNEFFEGNSLALAMGMKSDSEMAHKLEGKVAELYTIGDCAEPLRLLGAMHSRFQVGRTV